MSDNGSGIPAELRDGLWTGTQARDNGLGLPGVKRMVEACSAGNLHGSIRLVEDPGAENTGAVFEIMVPPLSGIEPPQS